MVAGIGSKRRVAFVGGVVEVVENASPAAVIVVVVVANRKRWQLGCRACLVVVSSLWL